MQRVIPILRTVSCLFCKQDNVFRHPSVLLNPFSLKFSNSFAVTTQKMAYDTIERGRLNGEDYRMFITKDGQVVSPFHDIPLYSNPEAMICNMVVEIPRWTNHKMEINKEELMNPIKQDVKKGKVRFVKNCFPHHGYIWNYGALPQTWEDCEHVDEETGGTKGDNDPLDVCEIGQKIHKRGSVIQVKVLGVICLIDEGETDWKIICIDVTDPLADSLKDINDVRTAMPGFLEATREWFKIYKIPDGKPPNNFAFDGEYKGRDYALDVIKKTNEQWKKLVSSEENVARTGLCCKNVLVGGSPYKIEADVVKQNVEQCAAVGPPQEMPDDVDKWHYVPSNL